MLDIPIWLLRFWFFWVIQFEMGLLRLIVSRLVYFSQNCEEKMLIFHSPPRPRYRFRVTRNLTKLPRRQQRERQKTIGLMSKTTILHVHHAFLYISLPSLNNYDVKILSLLGDGNGKVINSTISVRTGARSPLFSSSQNPVLLSKRTNWDNREKVWNDAKSVFQRRFHGRRRHRIVRSLFHLKLVTCRCDVWHVNHTAVGLKWGNILTVNPVTPHYDSHGTRSNMFFILVFVIFELTINEWGWVS